MVQRYLTTALASYHGKGLKTRISTAMLSSTTNQHIKSDPKDDMVQQMRQVVQDNHDDLAKGWESLWQDGITPWDLGGPTETLLSEVQNRSLRPATTLIPGCGSGYDLVSLGRHLDDLTENSKHERLTIVGLEFSKTSLQKAQSQLAKSLESHGNFKQTKIVLYEGDFFHSPSSWKPFFSTDYGRSSDIDSSLKTAGALPSDQVFDLIFDYTFFCAIPPDQRRSWGSQMARLLAPNGRLLTLMFPYHTSARKVATVEARGPPYLVTLETYKDAVHDQNLEMDTPLPYGSLSTARQRQGQEFVGWWHKAKL